MDRLHHYIYYFEACSVFLVRTPTLKYVEPTLINERTDVMFALNKTSVKNKFLFLSIRVKLIMEFRLTCLLFYEIGPSLKTSKLNYLFGRLRAQQPK